ncbi:MULTISPECIES: glycine-rich domain-containing protein [Aerosakkonemataceae]|uniref:glycine-rich domain-containing protein n=1 Tax=Aerosakkonemataceae TaxID=3079643 RepID=UPI00188185F5|nr:glycine-rich domain-containing protein-like [Phormidium sp. LEGE 05292]MBE9224120.1 hypothetical protein [Phormidium sp. LEGE 05292]
MTHSLITQQEVRLNCSVQLVDQQIESTFCQTRRITLPLLMAMQEKERQLIATNDRQNIDGILRFLQNLKVINLEALALRLMNPKTGFGWSHQQTLRAIARYFMFLFLMYLYPSGVIIPTKEIDRVWHTHIIDTRRYEADCLMLFGYFLHHDVCGNETEAEEQALDSAFTETVKLFENHFGAEILADADNEDWQIVAKKSPQRGACLRPRPKERRNEIAKLIPVACDMKPSTKHNNA